MNVTLISLITESGIFGYAILAYALVTAGAIGLQFVKAETRDFSQLLWGMIVGMVSLGVLGTFIGQVQACGAYLTRAEATSDWLVMAWQISLGPVVISSALATLFAIATGVAATKARRCNDARRAA